VLCAFIRVSLGGEMEEPPDVHSWSEIRHLSALPADLAKTLGWQGAEQDTIDDLEREPGNAAPNSVNRWFLLGGLTKTSALIVIEYRAVYRPFDRYRAKRLSLVGSKWTVSGEWALSSRPHTVAELSQMLAASETQVLNTQWRDWERQLDADRRRYRATPTPASAGNAPLRKTNINDEEVREIQAVVHELAPGAIVLIAGVTDGCPCEDGPACSAQVWTAIDRAQGVRSLELSQINGHWMIGPVQQWLLDWAQLDRVKFRNPAEYGAAVTALNNRFPACLAAAAKAP
jgi:hypothetical protein